VAMNPDLPIADYARQLTTIQPSFANDARSEAARLIAELAPGDLNRVFFTNGGAEATENALRMARLHTGRHKVLAAYRYGTTTLILPRENERDLSEVPDDIRQQIQVRLVENMDQMLEIALTGPIPAVELRGDEGEADQGASEGPVTH